MGKKDPRVDAYIDHSADFAKPILKHIRTLVHSACPSVEESMKWQMPFFSNNGILCMMAGFKAHCALRFWHPEMRRSFKSEDSMSHVGRITKISDLPGKTQLLGYLRRAVELNKTGKKAPAVRRPAKKLPVPRYIVDALRRDKKAMATFNAFSTSHQNEYVQWITEAKRDETRASRITKMLQLLAAGKSQNWKYKR
jgi:uncharacterized protein YdeI (YjbR/CyaY-like superfamily)